MRVGEKQAGAVAVTPPRQSTTLARPVACAFRRQAFLLLWHPARAGVAGLGILLRHPTPTIGPRN
jgi:hypothetical protein